MGHSTTSRINRRQLLLAATGMGLAGLAAAPRRALAWTASETTTDAGRVAGYFSAGVHVFKGVPYGASTQAQRFRPPQPVQPWTGVRVTRWWPAECPQYEAPAQGEAAAMFATNNEWPSVQSEDCLALNIWTPALGDGRKRPVMVWLHGGGFTVGSGSSDLYDGTRLCNKGDVVVVTLNHRLNLFGYLYLAGMPGGDAFADSGNVGMLDIVLALKWLRTNLAAFGGDPGNVTLFGESGGGAKVSTLLAMPAAAGLFHRAIIESGPGVRAIPPEDAARVTAQIFQRVGLEPGDFAALTSLPTARLVQALVGKSAAPMDQLRLGPVVDGRSLMHHPFDPAAPACSADVPVLIGTNADEISILFGPGDPGIFALTEAELRGRLGNTFGPLAAEILAAYRAQYPDMTSSQLYISIMSDHVMRRGSIELAERKSAQRRAPVYMYWFKKPTPVGGGKYGAPHTVEIPYVFDNVDIAKPLVGDDPSRYPLAEACSAAWLAFARYGNPGAPVLPSWRPYSVGDRATMILADRCVLEVDPAPAVRTVLARSAPWVF